MPAALPDFLRKRQSLSSWRAIRLFTPVPSRDHQCSTTVWEALAGSIGFLGICFLVWHGIRHSSSDPFCQEQDSNSLLRVSPSALWVGSHGGTQRKQTVTHPASTVPGWGGGGGALRCWGCGVGLAPWSLTPHQALGEEQSRAVLLLFFTLCLNTHRIKIRNWSQSGKHSEG